MDFPKAGSLPLFIHPWTIYGPGGDIRLHASAGVPAAATWTANLAVYIPIAIPWQYPVKRVFWMNGSTVTSAHCDFGIYTPSGNRIYSVGNTVQAGATAPQYFTPSPDFVLDPGNYFFAWVCDATTNHAFATLLATAGWAQGNGILAQALGSATLPASATFADPGTTAGVPLCGITRTDSGF
jgi:hypothetical protein